MTHKITIVGTGYIGLTAGVCLANAGNRVTCLDINEEKIEMLKAGGCPIFEPGLKELLEKNLSHLHFTTDYEEALKDAEIAFIAVTTPSAPNGEANINYVKSAATSIGKAMQGDLIVVNRSTVPVGTGHKVEKIIQKETGHKVSVISCPEFLREGSAIYDFMNPDRVVIGADDEHKSAVELLQEIYNGVTKNDPQFVITDLRSAEMIKYASNSFLATQISYINDLAKLCEEVDVDVTEVARGMRLDKRIGERAFLDAGLGYGGSCFPKDVRALVALGKKRGNRLTLLEKVGKLNDQLIERGFSKIKKLLRASDISLSEARITILGLSFKPNTDDIRESQSVHLIDFLLQKGAEDIRAIDPIVDWEREIERGIMLPKRIRKNKKELEKIRKINGGDILESIEKAVKDSDIIVLATEWNDFRNLDFAKLGKSMRNKCFVDLRNVYSKSEVEGFGFKVENVGRR
ncbi:UDP-glucose/GDP-mannose dehydrogenase family protein [Candidatus Peregrinibacteria bacterium]|jgi:UDPglucose 6-dehydrogenase|nr:UDP-glucose/GDP-mannose dehydrogenase family protein [Candidatus Peregrinibacteria bacterium]